MRIIVPSTANRQVSIVKFLCNTFDAVYVSVWMYVCMHGTIVSGGGDNGAAP